MAVAAGEACAMEAIAEAIAFGEHEASAQDGASDQYGAMGIEATSASADAAPDAAPGAAPDVAPDAAPDAAMWASVLHGWKVEETPATAPCGQAAASTATPANEKVFSVSAIPRLFFSRGDFSAKTLPTSDFLKLAATWDPGPGIPFCNEFRDMGFLFAMNL